MLCGLGKAVKVRCGPATVMGNEIFLYATGVCAGKAKRVDSPRSQETCHERLTEGSFEVKDAPFFVKGHI